MGVAAYEWSPQAKMRHVLDDLRERWGEIRQNIRPPLTVLVHGVLSQNTSDVNSARAFESLMDTFGDWPAVAQASREEIAEAIKSGGLAAQKSGSIRQILDWLQDRDGDYCLDFMRGWTDEDIEQRLMEFKGVGVKTARLTLLFGFDRPVFVVDTHVHRVARRIGLISESCGREKAHDILQDLIPPERRHAGHLLMIRHGRRTCKSRSPQCRECCVRTYCTHARGE
jgi:endonuclease-3